MGGQGNVRRRMRMLAVSYAVTRFGMLETEDGRMRNPEGEKLVRGEIYASSRVDAILELYRRPQEEERS